MSARKIGSGGGGGTGPAGAPGSVWRDGAGVPSNALGIDGDYYLRDTTGDVYLRTAGAYAIVANIKGAAGGGGSVATDAIFDAAGDLVQGTGADTAARLARGTSLLDRLAVVGTSLAWLPAVVRKTADQNIAASTTLANITDLTWALGANEKWFFMLMLDIVAANAVMDGKIGWALPAGCTMKWAPAAEATNAIGSFMRYANGSTPTATLSESGTPNFGTAAAVDQALLYMGWVFNGANAGAAQLQGAQNTSDAGNLTFKQDSLALIWRLA